jgi:hypothetical protein
MYLGTFWGQSACLTAYFMPTYARMQKKKPRKMRGHAMYAYIFYIPFNLRSIVICGCICHAHGIGHDQKEITAPAQDGGYS